MKHARVAVARGVHPRQRHPFAVTLARQQRVDELLVGARVGVVDKPLDRPRRRRQPGQVKAHPPDECPAICFPRRLNPLGSIRASVKKSIWIPWPSAALHLGKLRTLGSDKSPMPLPLRALLDPALDRGNLIRRQFFLGLLRRHAVIRIVRGDFLVQQTLGRFAWHDDPLVAGAAEEAALDVESQLGLAMILVRPVALHAVMRQNRAHMHPKPKLLRRGRPHLAKRQPPGQHRENPKNFPRKNHENLGNRLSESNNQPRGKICPHPSTKASPPIGQANQPRTAHREPVNRPEGASQA